MNCVDELLTQCSHDFAEVKSEEKVQYLGSFGARVSSLPLKIH